MWHCIRRLNFNQMWTFGILENECQIALILETLAFLHNFFQYMTGPSILSPHSGAKCYSIMDSWISSGPLGVWIFYLEFLFFFKVIWALIDPLRLTLQGAILTHFGKGIKKNKRP